MNQNEICRRMPQVAAASSSMFFANASIELDNRFFRRLVISSGAYHRHVSTLCPTAAVWQLVKVLRDDILHAAKSPRDSIAPGSFNHSIGVGTHRDGTGQDGLSFAVTTDRLSVPMYDQVEW